MVSIMPAEKIKFTKEKETMLMTLFPRAMQSKWKNPILRDPWGQDAIQHIDYDADKMFKGVFCKIMAGLGLCDGRHPRRDTFPMLTKRYLEEHPDAIGAVPGLWHG